MNCLPHPLATLLMLCLATTARTYNPAPVIDPEALGFSSSWLARIGGRRTVITA